MTTHDLEVIEAMERHGGSFIQELARCARCADARNLEKIKSAFAEEWARYSTVPKLTEQQHNAFPKEKST